MAFLREIRFFEFFKMILEIIGKQMKNPNIILMGGDEEKDLISDEARENYTSQLSNLRIMYKLLSNDNNEELLSKNKEEFMKKHKEYNKLLEKEKENRITAENQENYQKSNEDFVKLIIVQLGASEQITTLLTKSEFIIPMKLRISGTAELIFNVIRLVIIFGGLATILSVYFNR